MEYKIIPAFLTNNDCYRLRKFRAGDPDGVVVHSTATRGVMFNRGINPWCKRWNKPGVEKLVHFMIDDTGIYQTQDLAYQAWHVGGSGNANLIGFEICEPVILTDRAYFEKVYPMAVWLAAYLVKNFGWKVNGDTVLGHYEAHRKGIGSNHADPGHWFPKMGKSMDAFRADVLALVNQPVTPPSRGGDRPATPPVTIPATVRKGSHGSAVIQLQMRLNKYGFGLVVDGDFGPKTNAAVREFQKENKLVVDGICGPKTWAELLK